MSIRLLGQTLGLRLARDAARRDDAAAPILELRMGLGRAEQEIAWLTARLARVPPRHRPHYTPTERWHWLECRQLHGWSLDETAQHALVSPHTVARAISSAIASPNAPRRRVAGSCGGTASAIGLAPWVGRGRLR